MHDASKSGGGVFDLLIHDVDFSIYAFGLPETLSAVGYEDMPGGIDWIEARLHYPSGAIVTITGGWHHVKSYPFSQEFTIVSDGGTLEFNSLVRPLTLYRSDGEVETPPLSETDIFQQELEYFLACASKGRRPDRCPPEESAAAVKLMRLMLESRQAKGETLKCRI